MCPTGVTTHNPVLVKQLDPEEGAGRLANFIRISTTEMANLARIAGKDYVSKLDMKDIFSLSKDLAGIAGISWLDGDPQAK